MSEIEPSDSSAREGATPELDSEAPTVPVGSGGDTRLPDWLRKLATESWQAELLISGFAIVGTSQLLDTLEPMAEWLLFHVRLDYADYLRWALFYLGIGFLVLPAIFIFHFALRAFWVGLVSLSSVYPEGIGPIRSSSIPDFFVEEVRRTYPPLPSLIDRVERSASVMFSLAALATIMFLSIAMGLLATFSLAALAASLSGGALSARVVFWVLAAIPFGLFLVQLTTLIPPLRGTAKGEKIYIKTSLLSNKLIYTVFEYPAIYLQTILMTNMSGRASLGPAVVSYVLLVLALAFIVQRPAASQLLQSERIIEDALRTDRRYVERYANEWGVESFIVDPYVNSERVVRGEPLAVYLPLLGEDDFRVDGRRPPEERPDGLDDAAWDRLRREGHLEAYADYYRFRVGDDIVEPAELHLFEPPGQADGLRAVLPAFPTTGRATLTVDTRASADPADTTFAPRAVIPLWVTAG